MIELNRGFALLKNDYVFQKIRGEMRNYEDVIDLSVGDVSHPLTPFVLESYENAVAELGNEKTFRGYPPSCGYPFLRKAIKEYYSDCGADIDEDEIFVTDGAKGEIFKLFNLFSPDSTVAIFSPYYPAFYDGAVLSNKKVEIIDTERDFFKPSPKRLSKKSYIIVLCSPSNPCGVTLDEKDISEWIGFAKETGSVILFDSAYSSFIRDETPLTPYGVEDSKVCIVEISSFSKGYSFTGVRCGFVVIPSEISIAGESLRDKYGRMNAAVNNGVNYAVQRAAQAALSPQGRKENRAVVDTYLENAKMLCEVLQKKGYTPIVSKNSPYLFLRCPNSFSSESFFKYLLEKARIACTPGNDFGNSGKGYVRISCLKTKDEFSKAVNRFISLDF